jgi:hypothetical protein
LFDIDLAVIKQRVESITRVRSATVARIIPNAIYVSVSERRPMIPARRESQAFMWLDEDGVELGEIASLDAGDEIPPIAKGFSEGARTPLAAADDRERIAVYRQLQSELGDGWKLIDQIDLTFPKHVNVRLTSPPVTVVLGSRDFRERFDNAYQIMMALRLQDSETLRRFPIRGMESLLEAPEDISLIDMSRRDQIVFSSSHSGREKTAQQEEASGEPSGANTRPKQKPAQKTVRQEMKR